MYNLWLKMNLFKRYHAFEKELNKFASRAMRTNLPGIEDHIKTVAEKIWKKHGSPSVDRVEYDEYKRNWLGEQTDERRLRTRRKNQKSPVLP